MSRSGKRRNPLVTVVCSPAEIELFDRAVEHVGIESRSDWIRNSLIITAAEELGLDPIKVLAEMGRDG